MYPKAVRRMLIRRSHEHPVTKAAAAGGNRMATCQDKPQQVVAFISDSHFLALLMTVTHQNEENVATSDHDGYSSMGRRMV